MVQRRKRRVDPEDPSRREEVGPASNSPSVSPKHWLGTVVIGTTCIVWTAPPVPSVYTACSTPQTRCSRARAGTISAWRWDPSSEAEMSRPTTSTKTSCADLPADRELPDLCRRRARDADRHSCAWWERRLMVTKENDERVLEARNRRHRRASIDNRSRRD